MADLEGNLVSMNQFQGKVVLLNFWGTWCGPCRVEIPDFVKLSEKYKVQGLEIVGVTLTSGPPNRISSFADQWGINYTLLTDINKNETQSVTALYGQATVRGLLVFQLPFSLIEMVISDKNMLVQDLKMFFIEI